MSSAIANASRLKPELRLAQAVSQFEASLSEEQRATLRTYKSESRASPPGAGDFMRLTAEVDRLAAGKARGGRCFGPRLSNILQSVQQFAACGDVAIGATQSLVACSVWSLVRMTLLLVANFSAYFDKLSALLMAIGRSAPRYEAMALLYPRSKELRSYLSEYFIAVVSLFHSQFKLLQKSAISQFLSISFLSDPDLKLYQSDCELWASSIKEEVNKLMAKDVVRQGFRSKALLKLSESESIHRRQEKLLRILDSCSTFQYDKAWKETRKMGYATLLNQVPEYQDWKSQACSYTLVCSGKLGSGKSVLLANMVDDLNLHAQNRGHAVAYFFCQHDNTKSLQARTIIGCLARQLLHTVPLPSGLDDLVNPTSLAADIDRITDMLTKVLPARAYFVIDGLDECDDVQRDLVVSHLQRLQGSSALLVCLSCRSEADHTSRSHLGQFARLLTFEIPKDNADIENYIIAELERRLESGQLKVGQPDLILEIEDALLKGAQGMFLWVALQIDSLCFAKTDIAIRQALADLPRDLPGTFSRILQKGEALGKLYQEQTLQIIVAACRSLTTDELREALSVVPGDTNWKPVQMLNDVYSALACCGSLVIVEEEDLTVRLVHHSVKQFLLNGLRDQHNRRFTLGDAMRAMRGIVITYLSYGIFDSQLSRRVVPPVIAGTAPSKIVYSTLDAQSNVRKVAIRLLRSRKQSDCNISSVLADESRLFTHRTDQFSFFVYAKSYWFQHIRCISQEEEAMYGLLLQAFQGNILDINARLENGQTPLSWAAASGHEAIVRLLLQKGAELESRDSDDRSPLLWAAANGYKAIVKLLLDQEADLELRDYVGQTPLSQAAANGHEAVVRLLLNNNADTESKDYNGRTPLSWAAADGSEATVRLLLEHDANIWSRDQSGHGPEWWAAHNGQEAVMQLLLDKCKTKDDLWETPLSWAAAEGHEAAVRLLLDKGADIKAKDSNGWTPLWWACSMGHGAVAQVLLDRGANIQSKDEDGQTLLSWAATNGNDAVVRLLLDKGADIESKDEDGQTALSWAATKGQHIVTQLLLDKGADIESKDIAGWTPLGWAAAKGKDLVVAILLREGADFGLKHEDGSTPLSWAVQNGHGLVARLLEARIMSECI